MITTPIQNNEEFQKFQEIAGKLNIPLEEIEKNEIVRTPTDNGETISINPAGRIGQQIKRFEENSNIPFNFSSDTHLNALKTFSKIKDVNGAIADTNILDNNNDGNIGQNETIMENYNLAKESLNVMGGQFNEFNRGLSEIINIKEDTIKREIGNSDLLKKSGIKEVKEGEFEGISGLQADMNLRRQEINNLINNYSEGIKEGRGRFNDLFTARLSNLTSLKEDIDKIEKKTTELTQSNRDDALLFAQAGGEIPQELLNSLSEQDRATFSNLSQIIRENTEREEKIKREELIIKQGVQQDPISSFNFSAEGMRTDRHNNPTAFTTEIAKQGGLVEGIDYEKGDAFPENENLFTARLLGNPIDTTIKLIDNIGFFTEDGRQRWEHTAIEQKEWNAMSKEQKSGLIKQMYKKEGGNGSLFGATEQGEEEEAIKSLSPLARQFYEGTYIPETPSQRDEIAKEVAGSGLDLNNIGKTEAKAILLGMKQLKTLWDKIPNIKKGIIQGQGVFLEKNKKTNKEVAEFETLKNLLGMQLARLTEKGRMSDEDREFYLNIMPNLSVQNPEVLQGNINSINEGLSSLFSLDLDKLTESVKLRNPKTGQVIEAENISSEELQSATSDGWEIITN